MDIQGISVKQLSNLEVEAIHELIKSLEAGKTQAVEEEAHITWLIDKEEELAAEQDDLISILKQLEQEKLLRRQHDIAIKRTHYQSREKDMRFSLGFFEKNKSMQENLEGWIAYYSKLSANVENEI